MLARDSLNSRICDTIKNINFIKKEWFKIGILLIASVFVFQNKSFFGHTIPATTVADKSACAEKAAAEFNSRKGSPEGIDAQSFVYENHLNTSQGKCFYFDTFMGKGTDPNSIILMHGLLNEYDNSVVATYFRVIDTSSSKVTSESCTIPNNSKCTLKEFDNFVDAEMERAKP